ncbi:MAG TPA: YggS family pyridoxal phosphate-dependent enzyme [Puia sp.]|jgi:pyridoxal phosphate enzyme (YggS family)|nr:YggS family pyridoxal phosphate-dependent enzyme [Puia sp.]
MTITFDTYRGILDRLGAGVQLVAVSKTKPVADILLLYEMGQRDFGENYVKELVDKAGQLPVDIRWHFIGHLQTNKVKAVVPFVHLIHGVDSLRLLKEIDRQAGLKGKVVNVLLQVHIAREETKFGLDAGELETLMREFADSTMRGEFVNVRVSGLMGMASNTADLSAVRAEFKELKAMLDRYFPEGGILSMGMSADYEIAIQEGSNMVRIGSLLFGERVQKL